MASQQSTSRKHDLTVDEAIEKCADEVSKKRKRVLDCEGWLEYLEAKKEIILAHGSQDLIERCQLYQEQLMGNILQIGKEIAALENKIRMAPIEAKIDELKDFIFFED